MMSRFMKMQMVSEAVSGRRPMRAGKKFILRRPVRWLSLGCLHTLMVYTLTESVQREIERTFAPEHWDYVRSRFAGCGLPMDRSAPPPRVHIAVIWLSKGDLKRFDSELESAWFNVRFLHAAIGQRLGQQVALRIIGKGRQARDHDVIQC
jgi:hypothetical protein